MQTKQPKICIVFTVDESLDTLFPDFYPLLIEQGYNVFGVCSDTSNGLYTEKVRRQGVKVINIPMERDFSVLNDIKCLWLFMKFFKKEKFDIIHYASPKASLLTVLAAILSGSNSYRLYTMRGLGYASYAGVKKWIAKLCEKIACRGAHKIIAISKSLADEARKKNLVGNKEILVLGSGSSKGVNLNKFNVNDAICQNAKQIRQSLNIGENDIVIGFVGRFSPEKGMTELFLSFSNLCNLYANIHLLIVGEQDKRVPLKTDFLARLKSHPYVYFVGTKTNVEDYYAAMDIFVLPSYREGFGNVLIEAAAMKVPVIATDIPGCRDAVRNNETGFLVKAQDTNSLQAALEKFITDADLREKFGNTGYLWVRENFDRFQIWTFLFKIYAEIVPSNKR